MIEIIYKKGDNTVCVEDGKYFIDYNDGFAREYPIHYGEGRFAYDFPERVPKYLKDAYEKHVVRGLFQ